MAPRLSQEFLVLIIGFPLMRRFRLPAALLAILIGLPAAARAQTHLTFQDEWSRVQKARFSLGPLRIFPGLSLQDVGYDDNIYFEQKAKGDYTGTFVPEARIYWPLRGWLLLSAREAPEYTYYLREKNRREFGNSYALGAKALLFRRIVASGDFQFEKHRGPLSSELGSAVTDTTKSYDAGLAFETPRKSAISLGFFVRDIAYEDFSSAGTLLPLAQSLDRRERGGTAELDYQAFYEGYLFLCGNYTEYSFRSPASAGRDASSVQVSGGLRFPLTGAIQGTLALGYKTFASKTGEFPRFSGLVGNTQLDGRFGRLGLHLRYRRDNPFSFYESALYFVEDDYGAGISVYLTDFLRLDYNYDHALGDYPEYFTLDPATGARISVARRDRHWTHAAGLVLRIFAQTGLGLTWNSVVWTSTLPGWDRHRSFIGLSLTQRF
jgi:hypothetical protein